MFATFADGPSAARTCVLLGGSGRKRQPTLVAPIVAALLRPSTCITRPALTASHDRAPRS